jgi:hypothetical protein
MRVIWPNPKWTVWLVPGGLLASGLMLSVVFRIYPGEAPGVSARAAAFGFALAALAMLRFDTRGPAEAPARRLGINAGLIGGGLWLAEIAFNNISRSSAATRLWVDDGAWAVIALIILVAAFIAARRGGFMAGLANGFWSGTVSGVIACLTALGLIVFFMKVVLADPLNIAEYADRVPSHHPGMATYFAYETVIGALGHLIVLGTVMGVLLGAFGGVAGSLMRRLAGRVS